MTENRIQTYVNNKKGFLAICKTSLRSESIKLQKNNR